MIWDTLTMQRLREFRPPHMTFLSQVHIMLRPEHLEVGLQNKLKLAPFTHLRKYPIKRKNESNNHNDRNDIDNN